MQEMGLNLKLGKNFFLFPTLFAVFAKMDQRQFALARCGFGVEMFHTVSALKIFENFKKIPKILNLVDIDDRGTDQHNWAPL